MTKVFSFALCCALGSMVAAWAQAPQFTITTVAGNGLAGSSGDGGPATSAELNGPRGVTADLFGNVYIAEFYGQRVRKVSPGGTITTLAGNGTAGYSGDGGLAKNAKLEVAGYPVAVVIHGQKAMPQFGSLPNDQQIADVVNYVRTNFGNKYKDKVSAADVKAQR